MLAALTVLPNTTFKFLSTLIIGLYAFGARSDARFDARLSVKDRLLRKGAVDSFPPSQSEGGENSSFPPGSVPGN